MSDLKGVGVSSAAHSYGSHSSQDRVTTAKVGEYTLADVARRLGNGVTEEALRKENPHIKNSVQPGQDIRLPPRDEVKSSKPKKDETSSKPTPQDTNQREVGKEYPKKDKDVKVPEKTVGGVNVQVPRPTLGTDDTYERGTNRKDDKQRLDNARRPDDRDLDPKVQAEEKRNKTEGSARKGDRELKKGIKEGTPDGKRQQQLEQELKDRTMKDINDRLKGVPKQKHF